MFEERKIGDHDHSVDCFTEKHYFTTHINNDGIYQILDHTLPCEKGDILVIDVKKYPVFYEEERKKGLLKS